MPTISRRYHSHTGRYRAGGNSCDYVVVHNTGNTATAEQEARNQQNNSAPSGAHYFLDGGGIIYQLLDDTDTAWAVGAWSGARQLIGNRESISIEVCSDGTEFTGAEVEELAWLVQRLMREHGIPASHVVRHYDCHTGHKDCPGWYVPQARWEALHAAITAGVAYRPGQHSSGKASDGIAVDGLWGRDTTRALQRVLGTPVDGIVSNQHRVYAASNPGLLESSWQWVDRPGKGSPMVAALQRKIGATDDGWMGPETIRELQAHLGTPVDGKVSKPSMMVRELQRRLNAGRF